MNKRHGLHRRIMLLFIILMCTWIFFQFYGIIHSKIKMNREHIVYLLYQVSLFQVEMLNNAITEATNATQSHQLDALKQAAFSFNYSHDRLTLALKKDGLTAISAISQLQQFILSTQLSGERNLGNAEMAVIKHVRELSGSMHEIYALLVTTSGELVPSQSKQLAAWDQALTDYLQREMLK